MSGKLKTQEKFIIDALKIHGNKYDYSLVDYAGSYSKVKIKCPIHGVFEQKPCHHLLGKGCSLCGVEDQQLKIELFIKRSKNIHNNKYDYSKSKYINAHTIVTIICPEHGEFEQIAGNHFNGAGCPSCKMLKVEKIIEKYLKDNQFFFKSEFKFFDCKNKRPLPFDFAVFEDEEKTKLKCLIEYDGEQHYKLIPIFHMTYEKLIEGQTRDKIKTDYCLKNNIKLIRIPYWEKHNIKSILDARININIGTQIPLYNKNQKV